MPASSMLLLILMLWSIPVLIYAALFSPELAQLAMGGIRVSKIEDGENTGNELPFEYLLPMVAAATVALMFSLLAGVSWQVCLMLILAVAALTGGVAFTLMRMHSLGLPQQASSPEGVARQRPPDPNRSDKMLVTQAAYQSEPYPHHEHYPESAGEDQGQLTSHLSGSTPFLENLDVPRMWRTTWRFLAWRRISTKD